jgi:hypothetical protein
MPTTATDDSESFAAARAVTRVGFFDLRTKEQIDAESRANMRTYFAGIDELSRDVDWRATLELPGNNIDWSQRVSFAAAPDKFATDWMPFDLSLRGMALLHGQPWPVAPDKESAWCLTYCGLRQDPDTGLRPRTYEHITHATAFKWDDDGVVGLEAARAALRASGYLTFFYTTPSHGKARELVPESGYQGFADKHKPKLPLTPNGESLSRFLNRQLHHGDAYRNVRLVKIDNEARGYEVSFDPQDRISAMLPYARDIPEAQARALVDAPKGCERFGRLVELELLGRNGGDASTFKPTQPSHMPVTIRGAVPAPGYEPIAEIFGQRLLDPVPLVERVLAETPKRTVVPVTALPCGSTVPKHLQSHLKGVRLGAMIANRHPELVRHRSDVAEDIFTRSHPLHLHRCPFSDEHGSRRGQSDGSLFIIDPDGGEFLWPTVKCRHGNTCGNRKTREFVDALIEQGALTHAEVFEDPTFRDLYKRQRETVAASIAGRIRTVAW